MGINKEPSIRMGETKVDAKRKIQQLYYDSITRRNMLVQDWSNALFYSPDLIGKITNQIAAEIGYQRAVRDLQNSILQMY